MLDPRRLEVLRAVAEHGSFTAAASALSFTQPAVSKQIAALEQQAGAALLERSPRGVRLTQAGSVLVEHAEAIAQRLSTAEEQLEALALMETGRLRLAAFPTAVATVVAEAVAAFDKSHPAVALTLEERLSDESLDLLREGQVDLALVAAGVGVALMPGLGLAMLRDDIVVRRMTPDAPKRRVSAALAANGYTAPAVPAMLQILREQCAEQAERVERFAAA